MADEVKIEGIEELTEKLDGLIDPVKLRMAMGTACALVEGEARKKAPKDSGELRRSITSKVEGEGSNTVGIVYTPLEYAPYVEFGTGIHAEKGGRSGYWVYVEGGSKKSKDGGKTYTLEEAKRVVAIMRKKGLKAYYTNGHEPKPFLRPALNENREEIKRKLRGAILTDD